VAESVLDKLRELQQADLELRRLEQKKVAHDRAAKVRSEQIARQKEHIESLRAKQREARMAADRKELEVRQKRTEIEKLRGQQTQVKDNRQFAALQNEIKFAELAIGKFEDEILADMGDIDGIEAESKQAGEEIKRQEVELLAIRKEIAAKKDAVDAEIATCRKQRDAIAGTLPAKMVDQFTRIADRLSGEALAAVIRDEDEDDGAYVCGGCHMSVTQNTYVLLASRNENLCTCPNCTRILYLERP
jgi:predicted  nucleic acid-binding Zn-ribbon protein